MAAVSGAVVEAAATATDGKGDSAPSPMSHQCTKKKRYLDTTSASLIAANAGDSKPEFHSLRGMSHSNGPATRQVVRG